MKKYLTILALAAFGLSGAAHSALECKFNSNDTLLIMSPGTQPVITPLPVGTVTTPVQISNTIIMETTPALTSSCEVGDDGENVYQMTNKSKYFGPFSANPKCQPA